MTSPSPRFPRLLERFDPFDPECGEHFFEVVDELREHCPVAHSDAHGGFWVVTRFDDVRKGFSDDEGLSTIPTATIPANPGAIPLIPYQADPEDHAGFRRLLDPYFKAGAVAKYEDGIRRTVTRLIDAFIERGRCEFIAEFARPLPGDVVFGQLLGLPGSEVDEAFHWTLAIMHDLDKPHAPLVHRNFMELINRLLAYRRTEPHRDDVVDALLHGIVSGRPVADDEVLRTLMHVVAAGLDTTYHTLGNVMVTLAQRPALRERLQAEPELLPDAIEEFLRWRAPAGGLVRTARRDVVIGGQQIRAGERVLLLVASANRDPREFEAPDEIDFHRQARSLAFGYGAHHCLGVHLGRLELRVALEELLARLDDVRLVDERVTFDSGCSRGPSILNISFAPGPRRG